MCGFYSITFAEYMLAGKTLLDYTNLISTNHYKKNDKIILEFTCNASGTFTKHLERIQKFRETCN